MSKNRLLVIAPDLEFRNSLDFALSAEGYDVTALADCADARPERFDAVVIHGAALPGSGAELDAFLTRTKVSVLLAEKPLALPTHRFDQYVETPLLGPALIEAVQKSLERDAIWPAQ